MSDCSYVDVNTPYIFVDYSSFAHLAKSTSICFPGYFVLTLLFRNCIDLDRFILLIYKRGLRNRGEGTKNKLWIAILILIIFNFKIVQFSRKLCYQLNYKISIIFYHSQSYLKRKIVLYVVQQSALYTKKNWNKKPQKCKLGNKPNLNNFSFLC